MLLYLSSQKLGNNITLLKRWIRKNRTNKILLIFNALDAKSEDKIKSNIEEDTKLLKEIGFKVKIIDLKEYFGQKDELKQEISNYKAYCIMGGNVFILRQAMKYSGFDEILKENSLKKEYLYIGYSAGSYIISKDLKKFDIVDEPVDFYKKGPVIYEGIGIIDYTIIPHYKSNYHKVHLIDKVVEMCQKENIKFRALKDGEVIIEEKTEKSYLEKCLPTYLERDIQNLKDGIQKNVSYLDCLINEVQGSVNSAWVDGDITEEQCDYLYEKYIRMEI